VEMGGKIEINTSEYEIGGVLSQEQEEKWKSIPFLLRTI